MNRLSRTCCLTTLALVLCATLAAAQEPQAEQLPDFKLAARKLREATVTVRVSYAREEAAAAGPEQVAVCSGVMIAPRLIATHIYAAPSSRIRATLPGGGQATAQLVALDEYSGLALLEVEQELVAPLTWNTAAVQAGQWVLSCAAWGAEDPVVSLGVVSAPERTVPEASFPPLVECDMRSADTSSGAGVVNQRGELLGLVAAVQSSEARGGWTYVVPISHAGRLMRAWQARPESENVLVLKRRRPVVGMVLTVDNGAVVAGRVSPNGPAAKAGIEQGDIVLAVEGVNIRSVYDVQRPVLHRQPGDELRLLIDQQGKHREVKVVLGGGVVLPPALGLQDFSRWVRPKYEVQQLADGRIVSRNARGQVRELAAAPAAEAGDELQPAAPELTLPEKLELLEKALDRYQRVIALQQAEIDRRGTQQQQLEAELQQLREQMMLLNEKLEGMAR